MAQWNISDYYRPHPKQQRAHEVDATEILFGGARGGGKTWLIMWDAFMHCMQHGEDAFVLILRRKLDDLDKTFIRDIRRCWPDSIYDYNKSDHDLTFRNGALMIFRSLENPVADIEDHKGRQYTQIYVDESTQTLPNEELYEKLLATVRAPHAPEIRPRVILCTNPGGPGHKWHKSRFVDPVPAGRRFMKDGLVKIFIQAKVFDNPYIGESYINQLRSLPEHMRKAHLHGSWEVYSGQAFQRWDEDLHVVDPFEIPKDWIVRRGLDWGWSQDPFYWSWLAKPPDREIIYLVDDWHGAQEGPRGGLKGPEMPVREVARQISDRERSNNLPFAVSTEADPEMWRRDMDQDCVADMLMKHGIRGVRQANNDRQYGYQLMQECLGIDRDLGQPRFKVFSNCRAFIESLPELQVAEGKEDVAKGKGDDPYDSVRYALCAMINSKSVNRAEHEKDVLERKIAEETGDSVTPIPI